jgi:hypothetical protein
MAPTRYTFDSDRSCIWVSGRSSLHPIRTETRGISGWFEATRSEDGGLDPAAAVSGRLELSVDRLTSGNRLYDRELHRRIDSARYPTIVGRLTGITPPQADRLSSPSNDDTAPESTAPEYTVTGDVTFHGRTLSFAHEMRIELGETGVRLSGEDTFDIRSFGMTPPSMLMVRIYPEVHVRVELIGTNEEATHAGS